MKNPFRIFPSIGYRNSQFQVLSEVDNLKIEIYNQDKIVKSIESNSNSPTLITSLNSTGKLIAKCRFKNEEFQQEIEIKQAFRLGSSEFKKAFVFDDTKYSFLLMKDRLLLFDEKKKILLTENHYSPTEIHKINKTDFLFKTKVGSSINGITNLGIYNTETFSIIGELLNEYQEIKILPEKNKAWLYNIKSKTIHCFALVQNTNRCFIELKKYDGFSNFFIDESSQSIFINYLETLDILNINNIHNTIEIPKMPNNAIDKLGNVFEIESHGLTCTNYYRDSSIHIQTQLELNLQTENFIHIGHQLKSKIEPIDLNNKVEEIKDEIISSIPKNKTFDNYLFSEKQQISDSYISHRIYPTIDGIFLIQQKLKRNFKGIIFRKQQSTWTSELNTIERKEFSISFLSSNKVKVLIDKTPTLTISEYHYPMLLVNNQGVNKIFSQDNQITIENGDSVELITINRNPYFIIGSKKKFSLYRASNFQKPILEHVDIMNPNLIKEHQIIWYSGHKKFVSKTNYLNAFDLKTSSRIFIDERIVQHSLFKDASDFNFKKGYALSSNQIVFNPVSLEVRDAFIGKMESYSKNLNKIISYRESTFYFSTFNTKTNKYELSEIPIDEHKYKESYLSPNGQFLVLQDESNKYAWYDIEKNEIVKFISGNFLSFRKDGSLIVEQDERRAVKIIDPKTFQDITPPNYHHYRFLSPNGKLYAHVASKTRYLDKLNGKELTVHEFSKYNKDLDDPRFLPQGKEREQAKILVDKNRQQIYNAYKEKFDELGIDNHNKINSQIIVKVTKYIEIGIVGTNVMKEIILPQDTEYFNYAAFSYDNQFVGIVGKPYWGSPNKSLIMLCRLAINYSNSNIELTHRIIFRIAERACWVCGFSQKGYFATYDSKPDTFLINTENGIPQKSIAKNELRQSSCKLKSTIYQSQNEWEVIIGKNFLCFSPTGNFLALSEQGYEPLTLGGYGHQESNVVHIAKTTSGEIINSFTGHGDKIKANKAKKVTFVAFSEDEKRIMTLSSDGVVIIRDIEIKNKY